MSEKALHAVCTLKRRASTHNSHSKGHQWWTRDVHHLSETTSPMTLCGRDATGWIDVEGDINDLASSLNCCVRCAALAKALGKDQSNA